MLRHMTYSDILATVAIVISLGGVGFTAYRTIRWEKPIVTVSGGQWMYGDGKNPAESRAGFSIDIFNAGNEETQVLDAYWDLDRGDEFKFYVRASARGGINAIIDYGDSEFRKPAPKLPFKLGKYEHSSWEFDIPLRGILNLERIHRARPVVEYTSRKNRQFAYGDWETSQLGIAVRGYEESQREA